MMTRYLVGFRRQLLAVCFILSISLFAVKKLEYFLFFNDKIHFPGRIQSSRIVSGINDSNSIRIAQLDEIVYANRTCQCMTYINGSVKFTNAYVNDTPLYTGMLANVEPVFISMNTYGYPQMFKNLLQVREPYRECERFYNDTQQSFRVFHNVLNNTYDPRPNDVTLLAQLTVDRMDRLEKLLHVWPGPLSVVIYIYKHCLNTFMQNIKQSKLYRRNDVFLHLAVPQKYLDNVAVDFPVSMLRNMALRGARTDYVFYIDVDFVPNPDAFLNIQHWLKIYTVTDKIAFIVPGFDVKRLSSKKEDFIQDINSGAAYLFHVKGFPPAHKPTDVERWMWTNFPYEVQYKDCFEPFCVFPRRILPAYPEIVSGRQRDKITQVRALHEFGFKFLVLPDAFIMHIDHPRPPLREQKDMMYCASIVYSDMKKTLRKSKHLSESYSVIHFPPTLEQ